MSETQTISLKQYLLAIEGGWFPAAIGFLLLIGLTALDKAWATTNSLSQSSVRAALQQNRDAQSQLVIARTCYLGADPIVGLRTNFLHAFT